MEENWAFHSFQFRQTDKKIDKHFAQKSAFVGHYLIMRLANLVANLVLVKTRREVLLEFRLFARHEQLLVQRKKKGERKRLDICRHLSG